MRKLLGLWLMAMLATGSAPAFAQAIQSIDPNTASAQQDATPLPGERGTAVNPPYGSQADDPQLPPLPSDTPPSASAPPPANDPGAPLPPPQDSTLVTRTKPTYHKDDLIGAAEGVFGKGAAGLAGILEKILKDQGEPNAYIAGREASGAFVVGLRYGSGTLKHKIEGERPVYWTGPVAGLRRRRRCDEGLHARLQPLRQPGPLQTLSAGGGARLFRRRLFGDLSATRGHRAYPCAARRRRPARGEHRLYEVQRVEPLGSLLSRRA